MKLTYALLFSAVFSANLLHASDLKPGLWNVTSVIKSKSGRVEKQLALIQNNYKNYPPAERKIVEESMAERGIKFSPDGNMMKICMSKEQVEKLAVPEGLFAGCKHHEVSRAANNIKMKFTCKTGTADGEFNVTSPTTFVSTAVINTVLDAGPEVINVTESGKWLNGDCGNIKPEKK